MPTVALIWCIILGLFALSIYRDYILFKSQQWTMASRFTFLILNLSSEYTILE